MGILSYFISPLSALSDHQTKKASKKAVAAVQAAADQNTALARNIYDTTRNDLAPGRAVYGPSIAALAARSGLGGAAPTGARGTAGTSPPSAPPPSTGARYDEGTGGSLPANWNPGAAAGDTFIDPRTGMTPGGAAPAPGGQPAGQPDWAAYGAANPDVQAEWQHIVDTGNAGNDKFQNDPNKYYQWHYDTFGKDEVGQPGNPRVAPPGLDGAPPTDQPQPAGGDPGQPQDGGAYIDPNGDNYGAGGPPAPYDPSQHAQFKDPGDAPAFNFKFDPNADPGYAWSQSEAARGGNASFGAKGLLKSGGAIKAAQDRSFHLADTRFNTAYDQYMRRLEGDRGQFNADRSANFNIYNTNRNFDYGQTRDTRGDWETDRGFGAGRYDQDTSNLFGLSTLGQNAAAGSATAGNIFTSAASANNNNVANARANKALSDNSNSFFNQIIPAVANVAGRYASGGF